MSRPILTLRVNRRAVGAAVLDDDQLVLADGRHLASGTEKAVAGAVRFVERLIAAATPRFVAVDGPAADDRSTTGRIVAALTSILAEGGVDVVFVAKAELLAAYGVRGLHSRAELRDLVRSYWPELADRRGDAARFVADAAAAALYADCRRALEGVG